MSPIIKARFDPKAFDKVDFVGKQIRKAIATANFQLAKEVSGHGHERHPVDTGFAQASWWVQNDGAPAEHPAPPPEETLYLFAKLDAAIIMESAGKVFSVVNSAEYIRELEYEGHSKQNSGWVERSAARYRIFLDEAIAYVKKESGP